MTMKDPKLYQEPKAVRFITLSGKEEKDSLVELVNEDREIQLEKVEQKYEKDIHRMNEEQNNEMSD